MKNEGMNCKKCGWPMQYSDKYCGHCGATNGVKNNVGGIKLLNVSVKVVILIIMIFVAIIGTIFLFPIGFLSWIIPGAIYQQWFGSKSKLRECRCCHKKMSREAAECPKCGCPHPTF